MSGYNKALHFKSLPRFLHKISEVQVKTRKLFEPKHVLAQNCFHVKKDFKIKKIQRHGEQFWTIWILSEKNAKKMRSSGLHGFKKFSGSVEYWWVEAKFEGMHLIIGQKCI